jgi:uncharacterized protein YjbI with pentapeptide repeats
MRKSFDIKSHIATLSLQDLKTFAEIAEIDLQGAKRKNQIINILILHEEKVSANIHLLPPTDKQKTLREALDTSTKVNRAIGLSFTALMFYILLIVLSTTDLQLFLPESKVNLPIIDIELPILGFYAAVPFIILVFHFYLLINLKHHQDKYRAWKKYAGKDGGNMFLDPILINFVDTYEAEPFTRKILVAFISLSIFYFPMLDIIWMQYRISDCHSLTLSAAPFLASVFDGILIIWYCYQIFPIRRERSPKFIRRLFSLGHIPIFFFWLGGLVLLVSAWNMFLSSHKKPSWLWTPRIDLTHAGHKVGEVPDGFILHYLGNESGDDEAIKNAYLNFGRPLAMEDTDLRFSTLNHVNLIRADLRKCNFTGASMARAHLEGCDLSEAHLEWSFLDESHFDGAKIRSANFERTGLRQSHFKGAILKKANFEGANLFESFLEGADLDSANLGGINLQFAHLEGANLLSANMQAADLRGAHLEGANLTKADLKYSNLRGANLQGADLRNCDLRGAILDSASIWGTNLLPEQLIYCIFQDLDQEKMVDWDSLIERGAHIPNTDTKRTFVSRIENAKGRSTNWTPVILPSNRISESDRLKFAHIVGSSNKYVAGGIAHQYNFNPELQKIYFDSLCSKHKYIIMELKDAYPKLVMYLLSHHFTPPKLTVAIFMTACDTPKCIHMSGAFISNY